MVLSVLKYILVPSNIISVLFILGIILFALKRFRRVGWLTLIISVCIYVFFGVGPVSYWLLGRLENHYPYLKNADSVQKVEHIVVLSGYADNDLELPLSSRVNSSSAFRLLEALRIHKEISKSKIIITGAGAVPDVMKEVLKSMGVRESEIIVEKESRNTYDSLKNIKDIVKDGKFILVTSAGHMPRSMGISRRLDLDPIPAPTDYLALNNNSAISYLPSPQHLIRSDLAMHEYLGIYWYTLNGRM